MVFFLWTDAARKTACPPVTAVCFPPVCCSDNRYVNQLKIIGKPKDIPDFSQHAPANLDFAGVFLFYPVEKPVENVDNLC